MNLCILGIGQPGGNPRVRFGAASGRYGKPVVGLRVEGLESRRLLAVSFNDSDVRPGPLVRMGTVVLAPGSHILRFTVVRRSSLSRGYYLGID
jgi:hypothetical protein